MAQLVTCGFLPCVNASEGYGEVVIVKAGGGKRLFCWVDWLKVDGVFVKIITTVIVPVDETTFFAAYGVDS